MAPEYLEQLIQKVAQENGMQIYSIEYKTDIEKGNNYLSSILPVTLTAKNQGKPMHLIAKMAQTNEEIRNKRPILLAFQREFQIYHEILPELLKFQEAHHISQPFYGKPQYYGGSLQHGKEVILLENLVTQGYALWEPFEAMDFDHMALVFREYAKLHVISLALRQKHPEKFESLTLNLKRNIFQIREALNPEHYQYLIGRVLEMGRKAVRGHPKAEEAHRTFAEKFSDFWLENRDNPEQNVIVISHGDCHPNNILFKSDKKVCLIDWQLSSVESPIHDISFVLCACASREALSRSEELFQAYYEVIDRNLQEFGCKVFSYESFKGHWKKHFLYGLYRAQMTLKLTLITRKESDELGENISILDILKKEVSPDSKFLKRMRDLFEVAGEKWL